MNPRTRAIALYAIAAIAILASANALAHSYAGLFGWAAHHRLTGWQAMSWPAEIDVFLAVGELALYVAYLDGWPARQRVWPWLTALAGLAVSVAGNIGHIQPLSGHPVVLSDRLTAATSPLAAFAGLTVGLLVLRMNRQRATATTPGTTASPEQPFAVTSITASGNGHHASAADGLVVPHSAAVRDQRFSPEADGPSPRPDDPAGPDPRVLREASVIYRSAAQRGERLSQRMLAQQLRDGGHRFSNEHLHRIAVGIGLHPPLQHTSTKGR